MTNKNTKFLLKIPASLLLIGCVLLMSCSESSNNNNTQLSATQINFEASEKDVPLNAIYWNLPETDIAPGAGHYFYLDQYSISDSPSLGEQRVTKTRTNLTSTLSLPATDLTPARIVVNGTVYVIDDKSIIKIKYSNGNIIKTYATSDNTQNLLSFVTDYWSAPTKLSGVIIGSDFASHNLGFTDLGEPHNFNENYSWLPNSAYVIRKSYLENDALFLKDWSTTRVSTGTNVIPLQIAGINTIEAYFNYRSSKGLGPLVFDGMSFNLTDGTIKTVQGLRTWIANTPKPVTYKPTTEYLTISEMNGMLYEGAFISAQTRTLVNDQTNLGSTLDYTVSLNDQAISSIKKLINF